VQITPASTDQVAAGRDGRRYLVTAEAGNIAQQLQEVDPRLFVEFIEPPTGSKQEGYYAIGCHVTEHDDDLVFTSRTLDGRVVERCRMLDFDLRHGRSQADRMDAEDAAVKRERDYRTEQEYAAGAARLMRAIQKDVLGINPRVSFYRPKTRAA
jgi:hypothetical protein